MIPAAIPAGITALAATVTSLGDLAKATRYDLGIVARQAASLLASIDEATSAAAGNLDAPDPSGSPAHLVADLVGLQIASVDQAALVAIKGFVGRAAFNLAQA